MLNKNITEAFSALNILDEETFSFDKNGAEKLAQFMDGDMEPGFEPIIDSEAHSEEELKDSYVGKVILSCQICHTLSYKDPADVVVDEESNTVNIDEECLYCGSTDGYKVVGQVADFCKDDKCEDESDVEEEPADEDNSDDVDVESEETVEDEEVAEEEKKEITEDIDDYEDEDVFDVIYGKLTCDGELYTKDRHGNKTTTRTNDGLGYKQDQVSSAKNSQGIYCISVKANSKEELDEAIKMAKHYDCDIEIKMNGKSDPYKYTLLIDYGSGDIEKIMADANRLGYDDESETEVDATIVNESFEKVDIETEDQKMTMTQDESGKVTVITEPKAEEETEASEEVIAPVSDEIKAEIETNSNEEESEVSADTSDEINIEFDEFDEESFDNLGESYLKRVYENVENFKTTSGKITDSQLMLEGIITFKSGKKAKTNFVFESHSATKRGKLKFTGSNKQLSEGKKAFTLTGSIADKKLISESFTYNYKAKDANTGSETRLYGTVRK